MCNIYLKLEKCSFNTSEVEYLGMIVKPGSLAMDPVKVAGIADWPIPSTVKDIRSFLGFANFYQCFVPHYSDTARPLLDLTKKTHPWSWDHSCNDAFTILKAVFTSQPVLHLPDLSAPFAISVTVEDPPIPFSPFSSADCTMFNHFSFNDFIAIAFPDIAGDPDEQI